MIRRLLTLPCEGATIAATLDLPDAPATAALLMVSGGSEPRSGPNASHARLAARLAGAGYAVLRFDRRGVGDSAGEDAGFRAQEAEIAAALAALRAESAAPRLVAFGNCDAASALMLGAGFGADALALANPGTFEEAAGEATMPVKALRAHYRRRLASPAALWRLVSGGVSLRKLAGALRQAAKPPEGPGALAQAMEAGLSRFVGPVSILVAGRDRTADAFRADWPADDLRLALCPAAGHAFLEPEAGEWLFEQLVGVLEG